MSGYNAGFSACGNESSPVAANIDGGSGSSSGSLKSVNYNDGYRGVAAAARDIDLFNNNKLGIDGDHPHTPCTLTDIPDYCKGYNKGYSDEVVDELD